MEKKNRQARPAAAVILSGALSGLAAVLLLLLAGAVCTLRGLIAEAWVMPCAMGCLFVGSLLGGVVSAHRAAGRKLVFALLGGAGTFLLLLVVGAAALHRLPNFSRAGFSLLLSLAGGALGGFFAVGRQPRHKYRHLKKSGI